MFFANTLNTTGFLTPLIISVISFEVISLETTAEDTLSNQILIELKLVAKWAWFQISSKEVSLNIWYTPKSPKIIPLNFNNSSLILFKLSISLESNTLFIRI